MTKFKSVYLKHTELPALERTVNRYGQKGYKPEGSVTIGTRSWIQLMVRKTKD